MKSQINNSQYNFQVSCVTGECMNVAGGKSASSFMERCIAFIGDNAADCIKTNAFLNLPKEALIKLISSDFVSTILFLIILNKRNETGNYYFKFSASLVYLLVRSNTIELKIMQTS